MNIDYIKKMFVGEILIVDDEVNEEYTDAWEIAEYLREQNFSVITKDTFPNNNELAGHKLSMVICDWMFKRGDDDGNAREVIAFLNKVQSKEFIPVFICTSLAKIDVERYLANSDYNCTRYKKNEASSIFVVKKGDIKNDKLFDFLKGWLQNNPSVKLLKEWEISLEVAKNNMFNELYNVSEYWPWVLAKTYKEDGERNIGDSMGEFVTKNLLSRISEYDIEDVTPDSNVDIRVEDVLEGERCYYYHDTKINSNTAFKTGDILKREEDLFIVIKRQCDLNRTENKGLYVLKMSEIKQTSNTPISINFDENTIQILENNYKLDGTKRNKINKQLKDVFSKTRVLHKGKILETAFQVIIPCVCHKKVVMIDLKELDIVKFESVEFKEYERVARLLEPYISIVTDKFAAYMSSKGSMRIPEELFTEKFFIDNSEDE